MVVPMKERLGYRYRIYPDARQARLFRQTVGCAASSTTSASSSGAWRMRCRPGTACPRSTRSRNCRA
ncbi:helix-turn-helix domain-containing protein [Rhizobium sullae]|uniref:helix-turn-helix domain-containing protein n=1 Tax=Rhizobium sullae TaxID=50338 RepID=UPI000A00D789